MVRGKREDIGKSAAREDDGFAGGFRRRDRGAGLDLCGSYCCDVGARAREGWVEPAGRAIIVATVGGDALPTISSDAIISGRVEKRGALKAKFHVLIALAHLIGGSQIRFVVGVRSRNCLRRGKATAVFRTLVATERIGIDCILGWIVPSIGGTV